MRMGLLWNYIARKTEEPLSYMYLCAFVHVHDGDEPLIVKDDWKCFHFQFEFQ